MPTFIFVMKQYLHLHLLWSHTIIFLCNEAVLALFFFHKTTSTFYLHWGHIYTSFIPKLCQHSFLSWSHDNTSFALKLCQRSTLHLYRSHEATSTIHFCHEAMTTLHISTEVCLKSCQYSFWPRNHVNTSFALKLCQHSSLSWNHDNTPHYHLHSHWSCTNICTEPRQNFICTEAVPTFMKPQSHVNTS